MKPPFRERLRVFVVATNSLPVLRAAYLLAYSLGTRLYLRSLRQSQSPLAALYVSRTAARRELVPGASDVDFFLVIEELGSHEEMQFLSAFWSHYRTWKKYLPFLGEPLILDRHELRLWREAPTLRLYDLALTAKHVAGEDPLREIAGNLPLPMAGDVLAECFRAYWQALEPLLRGEERAFFDSAARPIQLRNFAKATADFFRLHQVFAARRPLTTNEAAATWVLSREAFLARFSAEYSPDLRRLIPFLRMQSGSIETGESHAFLFALAHEMFVRTEEIARALADDSPCPIRTLTPVTSAHGRALDAEARHAFNDSYRDKFAYVIREAFAERLLVRHRDLLARAVTFDSTTNVFFLFRAMPDAARFRAFLADVKDAQDSIRRGGVMMPIGEKAMGELERVTFLDDHFHSFQERQVTEFGECGHARSTGYAPRPVAFPENSLRRVFLQLTTALRFQPPPDIHFLVDKIVAPVLQLRVAEETGAVPVDTVAALERYADLFPTRGEFVRERLAPYLHENAEAENHFWERMAEQLDLFRASAPVRADLLRARLNSARAPAPAHALRQDVLDLWIDLTPFLRLEMNTLRDRLFEPRSRLKL